VADLASQVERRVASSQEPHVADRKHAERAVDPDRVERKRKAELVEEIDGGGQLGQELAGQRGDALALTPERVEPLVERAVTARRETHLAGDLLGERLHPVFEALAPARLGGQRRAPLFRIWIELRQAAVERLVTGQDESSGGADEDAVQVPALVRRRVRRLPIACMAKPDMRIASVSEPTAAIGSDPSWPAARAAMRAEPSASSAMTAQ
jgi:hypothetical protein